MDSIFDYDVISEDGKSVSLHFKLDEGKLLILKRESPRQVHTVYQQARALGREDSFRLSGPVSCGRMLQSHKKCMKGIKYLTFRPIRHWTGNMIRVRAFFLPLALTLCSSLMNLELERLRHRMSIPKMLEKFG
jgi:hypothetical protein